MKSSYVLSAITTWQYAPQSTDISIMLKIIFEYFNKLNKPNVLESCNIHVPNTFILRRVL